MNYSYLESKITFNYEVFLSDFQNYCHFFI